MNLSRLISFLKQLFSKDFVIRNRVGSILVFLFLCIYTFHGVTKEQELVLSGDGLEYVLMTEALYNHHSPDVRAEDIYSFRKKAEKIQEREKESKSAEYERMLNKLLHPESVEVGADLGGFAYSSNKKCYSIHFFTYSLAVVPFVYLFKPFILHPIQVIWLANAIFLLLTVFIILFTNKNRERYNITVALLYVFSVLAWYLLWPHPEIFVVSFLFIGLWLFWNNNKYYLGLLLTAIAATQFQPLALIPLLLAAVIFIKEKYNVKVFIKLCCYLAIVLLPSLFYYTNFGVTNMVKHLHYLDSKYITFNRIFGFFFDFNQGLIIAFPLLFVVYLLLYVLDLFKLIKQRKIENIHFTHFIFPVAVIVVAVSASMGNWNGGGTVTHRYVNYVGILLLFHFAYLLFSFSQRKWGVALYAAIVASQVYTILFFGGIHVDGWTYALHKELPKYLLDHSPEKYNPDPWIFMIRTAQVHPDSYYGKGVVYTNDEYQFKKAIVHRDSLSKTVVGNLTLHQISSLIQDKSDHYGWIYINEQDVRNLLPGQQYEDFNRQVKINKEADNLQEK